MNTLAIVATLFLICSAHAVQFEAATLSESGDTLTLSTRSGAIPAPRTTSEQQGFSDAKVSSNRSLVGWLALTSNCCTSYPLPTSLVIFRDGRVVRSFVEAPPIWSWSFQEHNTAVAYRQEYPHGISPIIYKLRRISDGRSLGEFVCAPTEGNPPGTEPQYEYSLPVPSWVRPIAGGCPPRQAGG